MRHGLCEMFCTGMPVHPCSTSKLGSSTYGRPNAMDHQVVCSAATPRGSRLAVMPYHKSATPISCMVQNIQPTHDHQTGPVQTF